MPILIDLIRPCSVEIPGRSVLFLNKGNREEVDMWDMGGKTEPGRGGEIGNCSHYVINERIKV